ncbi:asparagine synthase-related protein [Streptomyces sp. PT12]|uniref:asparagine synthase-related protein n=1 Tax=Streptomyces sp. PT12 TaxID=1510197 RepID=UPI000DE257FE|nr:asparagine synthase-related protein [Streptomyces sp. PT12]RBM07313.1 asparagine synthase [Streptomyces sp. PT12]
MVIPDHEAAPAALRALRGRHCRTLTHASGRPWLIGCWNDEQLTFATAGETRLAVTSPCSLGPDALNARAATVRSAADAEGAVRGAVGRFHVLASHAGEVYARGSASGARRLYRAAVDEVTVAADRARTLAWLIGAEPDPAHLAARLAGPSLPHPLDSAAPWRGVHEVPAGHALAIDRRGRASTGAWWSPPPGELPLAEGASAVHDALRAAVALRVKPGVPLAADLSGGLDSTSLCFLAAGEGAELATATLHWSDPANEDPRYAQRAAAALAGRTRITRLVFEPRDLPPLFAGADEPDDPDDEPSTALRDRVQQRLIGEALSARGATLRLTGLGGDHVATPPASYLRALLRRRPVAALRRTAAHRARQRWSLADSARMLLAGGSYARWLAGASRALRAGEPAPAPLTEPPGWGIRPRLPAWANDRATTAFCDLMDATAENAEPLAAERHLHGWIRQMRQGGRTAARLAHRTALWGLPLDAPFCDDAVLEACLALRPDDVCTPWSYKPLLTEALRGVLPDTIRARTTKDHCEPEWFAGLRAGRAVFARWADDSRLAAAGLVDQRTLHRAVSSPDLLSAGAAELEETLGVESWLRGIEAHPVPAHLRLHEENDLAGEAPWAPEAAR